MKTIKIAFTGDTSGITKAEGAAVKAMKSAGDEALKQGSRIDRAFETTAGHADNVASKGAQAAGAFSGLGSLAQSAGGNVGALGSAMVIAGTGTQAFADAGDLLNVVTETTIGKAIAAKGAIIGQAIASRSSAGASKVFAGAQWAVNAALEANPIGLVVVALAALGVGLILAYKKSATFRAIVNGAFSSVKSVVGGVLPTIENVVGYIISVPGKIAGLAGKMLGAGKALIGGLWDGLKAAPGAAGGFAVGVVNSIIDKLNGILPHQISINKGPLHFSAPLFPTIPHLASGGIITGPTLALLGDNPGGREAVIPLDKYKLGGGGLTIQHLEVHVPYGASAYDVGEALVDKLRAFFDGGGTI